MKWVRVGWIVLMTVLVATLMIATIIEKQYGTDCTHRWIYGSKGFIFLWGAVVIASTIAMGKMKLWNNKLVLLLHLSFCVVLTGALLTRLTGVHGRMMLHEGETTCFYVTDHQEQCFLPFQLRLNRFDILCHPGTESPMDYVSSLTCRKQNVVEKVMVRMNHVFEQDNYRIFQSGYDPAENMCILGVTYDPYGIAVTYTGYGMMIVFMLLLLISKNGVWRKWIVKMRDGMVMLVLVAMMFIPCCVHAADTSSPLTLPKDVAASIGRLYVVYQGRICPLQTLARDVTLKLYGSTTYRNWNEEQVVAGWFIDAQAWNKDLMLQKGAPHDAQSTYLIQSLCQGQLLKIIPVKRDGRIDWYADGDKMVGEVHDFQNMIKELRKHALKGNYRIAKDLLVEMRNQQERVAAAVLPSVERFQAERIYNALIHTRAFAMLCLIAGMLTYGLFLFDMMKEKILPKWIFVSMRILRSLTFLYLTVTIGLRGYVSEYVPLSNGYETMEALAWVIMLCTYGWQRKSQWTFPMSFLLTGFALLVALLGESDPPVTPLMPVLSSPLLSVHVAIMMIAYALFAFIAIQGITALLFWALKKDDTPYSNQLYAMSHVLLYPAVCCLAIGIVIGAVWANVSWGEYWSWDPKETWALITFLVYAVAVHEKMVPRFREPLFFHIYMVAAFFTVLITYFGVNYLLGGMHSYAG